MGIVRNPSESLQHWTPAKERSILLRLPFLESIERQGEQFFQTGRLLVETLARLIESVRGADAARLNAFYAREFSGKSLGLTNLSLQSERDGITIHTFSSSDARCNSEESISDWQTYIQGFEAVEEISLHLHRLEQWKSRDAITASVRFEHIGRPRGATRTCIDRAYFRTSWQQSGENLLLTSHKLIKGERVFSPQPHFVNVASEAGIAFQNQFYPPFLTEPLKFGSILYGPGGITAVDYDNNGLCDLFIPDGVESKLFRNRGDGSFEDVTQQAGLAGLDGVSVAVFADYDNDGFKDLFVSRTFRPNQLFHNNGDGTFTDVTRESGIGADNCTTVAAWADYDNDGYLDLYVGRYVDPRQDIPTTFYARNGEPNQLYHNNGDGTFTNVTERAGVGDTGLCLGVVWGDYNDDGYPDLYVVNDFGRKTLYRNNGNGTFKDVTVKSNTLAYGAGMSASFVDYDNDGKFDYYVTHIRSDHAWLAEAPTIKRYLLRLLAQGTWKSDIPLYFEMFRQSGLAFVSVFQQMSSGNTLLRNKGDGSFEDVTRKADANPPGWFWGAVFADFDNDGWQDLYAANGWVYSEKGTEFELEFLYNVVSNPKMYKSGILFDPAYLRGRSWHGWERNRHLRNNGDGTFSEIGNAVGTDLLLNSRGVAVADFWNRGVMDIAVAASVDRHALLKNVLDSKRNWLQVELVGTKSNRDAIGARVTIHVNGSRQSREVVAGDSYGSQSPARQHFGLNQHDKVDKLIVYWPASGITQVFENVSVNRIVEITEGHNQLIEKSYASTLD